MLAYLTACIQFAEKDSSVKVAEEKFEPIKGLSNSIQGVKKRLSAYKPIESKE